MAAMEGITLGQQFEKGQAIFLDLEETTLSTADDAYQTQLKTAMACLQQADLDVGSMSIFSDNEVLSEINTNDLRFLLIPAYLGDLILRLAKGDRRSILSTAEQSLKRFLDRCRDYQLMKVEDSALLEREEGGARPSAAQQREHKIARYRREKATREMIKKLCDEGEQEDEDEDETKRAIVLARIELFIIKSIEGLHGIQQELVMVEEHEAKMAMMASRGEHAMEDTRAPARSTWGAGKPLMTKEGRPLQPFVITNQRKQLQDQVFRPGWSLPTMTIDEYLQQEEERGNIIQGGGKEPEEKIIDDNDDAAHDAETMKQRAWDEFTEANQRGAGNRGNKG